MQIDLWDSDDPVPRQELLQKVKGCAGLLCVLTEKIDAELLDAAGLTLNLPADLDALRGGKVARLKRVLFCCVQVRT